MPRKTISEETERIVEKHRNIKQVMEGRSVSFDEALNDLIDTDKNNENLDDLFRL